MFSNTNYAISTLAGTLSPTDTTGTLALGTGALFPTVAFGVVFPAMLTPVTGTNKEIVYVSSRSGDVVTLIRGQEGTTAQSWPAASNFIHGPTAGEINAALSRGNLAAEAHAQSVTIGPSYSGSLTLSFTPTYAGIVRVMGSLNLGSPANAAITTALSCNITSGGGDVSNLPQVQTLVFSVAANTYVFMELLVTSAAGTYASVFASYSLDYVFLQTST